MSATRTFTIIGVTTAGGVPKNTSSLGGLFKSKTPVSAAKKAARHVCAANNMKGGCTLIVRLRESTRSSKHKEYLYKVKRTRKETTVTKRTPENKKVKVVFKFVTKATSLNQFGDLPKKITKINKK